MVVEPQEKVEKDLRHVLEQLSPHLAFPGRAYPFNSQINVSLLYNLLVSRFVKYIQPQTTTSCGIQKNESESDRIGTWWFHDRYKRHYNNYRLSYDSNTCYISRCYNA